MEKTPNRTAILGRFAALGLVPLLLAGCAKSSDQYPSLATRDAERLVGQSAPVPAVVPAEGETPTTAPETFAQLRDIVEGARDTNQQFIAEQSAANELARAAVGAGPESDLRARALIAAAQLSVLNSQTNLFLSDLDQMEFSAASTFAPVGDISAAQILIGRMIADQDAVLDSLELVMTQ